MVGRAPEKAMYTGLPEAALDPTTFRASLERVPVLERDAWFDGIVGISDVPADGPDLPRGCVPYFPCSVEAVVQALQIAEVGPADVFVDVGAGIGRVAALAHLWSGARAVGVEIQAALVRAGREILDRANLRSVSLLAGDAAEAPALREGTVFFLYCPFGARWLDRLLDTLEPIARTHPLRVATVGIPPLPRSWLSPCGVPGGEVAVYRTAFSS